MGGSTQQTQSTVTIPREVMDRYNAVNRRAEQAAETPFKRYSEDPNKFVAGLNQTQLDAIENTNKFSQTAQSGFANAVTAGNQALGDTKLNPLDIEQYMNPYVKNVADTTMATLAHNNAMAQSGLAGQAALAGGAGSSRSGIAAANMAREQKLANAQTIAGLYGQGFNQAQQIAQTQQAAQLANDQENKQRYLAGSQNLGQLAAAQQAAGLQGAEAQMKAGSAQQLTDQAKLSAMYKQFQQEQAYKFQTANFLSNIATGTGANSGSTTTTTQPSSFFGWAKGGAVNDRSGLAEGEYSALQNILDDLFSNNPNDGVYGDNEDITEGDGSGMGYVPKSKVKSGSLIAAPAVTPQTGGGLSSFVDTVGKGVDTLRHAPEEWNKFQGLFKANGGRVGLAAGGSPYSRDESTEMDSIVPNNTPAEPPKLAVAQPPTQQHGGGGGLGQILGLGMKLFGLKNGGRVGYDSGGSSFGLLPKANDDNDYDDDNPTNITFVGRGSAPAMKMGDRGGIVSVNDTNDSHIKTTNPRYKENAELLNNVSDFFSNAPGSSPRNRATPAQPINNNSSTPSGIIPVAAPPDNVSTPTGVMPAFGPPVPKDFTNDPAKDATADIRQFDIEDDTPKPVDTDLYGNKISPIPDTTYSDGSSGVIPKIDIAPDTNKRKSIPPVYIANPNPAPEHLEAYRNAIANIESRGRGDYHAIGQVTNKGDVALGRYQIMRSNLPQWSKQALGHVVGPKEFLNNPDLQDAIFNDQWSRGLKKYTPQDMASVWFTGRPLSKGGTSQDDLGMSGNLYTKKFALELNNQGNNISPAVDVPYNQQDGKYIPTNNGVAGSSEAIMNPGYRDQDIDSARNKARGIVGNIIENDPAGGSLQERFDRNKSIIIPILQGLGAMASSRSRYLGTAILQGLGAGASAYADFPRQQAEIATQQATARATDQSALRAQMETEVVKQSISQNDIYTKDGNTFVRMADGSRILYGDYLDLKEKHPELAKTYSEVNGPEAQRGAPATTIDTSSGNMPAGQVPTQSVPIQNQPVVPAPPTQPVVPAPPTQPVVQDIAHPFSPENIALNNKKLMDDNAYNIRRGGANLAATSQNSVEQFNEAQKRATEFAANGRQILNLGKDLSVLPASASGTYAQNARNAKVAANSVLNIVGMKSIFSGDADTFAAMDAAEKQKILLAAAQSPGVAYASFDTMIHAIPNLGLPKASQAEIFSQILTQQQKALDENAFYNNYRHALVQNKKLTYEQTAYAGANVRDAFNQQATPRANIEQKALKTMFLAPMVDKEGKVMPAGKGTVQTVYSYAVEHGGELPPAVKAQLSKKYGPDIIEGMKRYFNVTGG